jgi:hypothetical protein
MLKFTKNFKPFFFFLLAVVGFELWASHLLSRHSYCLSHSASPFFGGGFFPDMVLETVCPGWL